MQRAAGSPVAPAPWPPEPTAPLGQNGWAPPSPQPPTRGFPLVQPVSAAPPTSPGIGVPRSVAIALGIALVLLFMMALTVVAAYRNLGPFAGTATPTPAPTATSASKPTAAPTTAATSEPAIAPSATAASSKPAIAPSATTAPKPTTAPAATTAPAPTRVPVSLPNGTDIVPPAGPRGLGKLTIKNGTSRDAVALLSHETAAPKVRRYVYVKANSNVVLEEIAAGSYRLAFMTGLDWDAGARKFLRDPSASQFDETFDFKEEPTPQGTRYSTWEVTLNPVAGGTGRTSPVPEGIFAP